MVGPGYGLETIFNLSSMQPYNLAELVGPLRKHTPHLALYLPRTSDLRQLAELIDAGDTMTVFHYCVEGASKVRTFPASVVQLFPPQN